MSFNMFFFKLNVLENYELEKYIINLTLANSMIKKKVKCCVSLIS